MSECSLQLQPQMDRKTIGHISGITAALIDQGDAPAPWQQAKQQDATSNAPFQNRSDPKISESHQRRTRPTLSKTDGMALNQRLDRRLLDLLR